MRESVTGLINPNHEVARLENLWYSVKGKRPHREEFGLDWRFWSFEMLQRYDSAFGSYLTDVAAQSGIFLADLTIRKTDYTLKLDAEVNHENSFTPQTSFATLMTGSGARKPHNTQPIGLTLD